MKNILFTVAECQGFVATGGLAEVAGSLPKAIMNARKTYRVSVVMPLYKSIIAKYGDELQFIGSTEVSLSWRKLYCGVLKTTHDGVNYYFIDNKYFFDRDGIYGHYDDGERFAFFSKSIFDIFSIIGFVPSIIHAHDWHTALTCIYLDQFKRKGQYLDTKSIFTIHNIEYQGQYDFAILGDVFGLSEEYSSIVSYNGLINLMKGAIVCCDALTTVSPTYAHEITTPEYSCKLDAIISQESTKLCGVINGINTELYNPRTDSSLPFQYDTELLDNKAKNKVLLQKTLGLAQSSQPIISMITRLTGHKGIDLVLERFHEIMALGVQFVVLGTGDKIYEDKLKSLEAQYPLRVKSLIEFNFDMAKKIYGSTDLFLMPSKSEPCGLSQMISSRYGTIPIVRKTGGLADTIIDSENGYVFNDYNADQMVNKIAEAVKKYQNPKAYSEMVKRVMNKDFSWNVSALAYIKLYVKFGK